MVLKQIHSMIDFLLAENIDDRYESVIESYIEEAEFQPTIIASFSKVNRNVMQ